MSSTKAIGYPKGKNRNFKKKNNLQKGKNTKKDVEQNKQIMKLEKKVNQLSKEPELKWVDEYNAAQFVPTTGLVFNVFTPNPVIGTGPNNRIGNNIQMTSLMTKILLLTNSLTLEATRYRILLVIDKEFETGNPALGGLPSTSSILDNSVITDLTIAPRNFNNVDRYIIKYDKIIISNPQVALTTTTMARLGREITINMKMKHRIQFLGPTNTIAELTGHIPLLYICSDRPGVDQPLTSVSQRVYYRDS